MAHRLLGTDVSSPVTRAITPSASVICRVVPLGRRSAASTKEVDSTFGIAPVSTSA